MVKTLGEVVSLETQDQESFFKRVQMYVPRAIGNHIGASRTKRKFGVGGMSLAIIGMGWCLWPRPAQKYPKYECGWTEEANGMSDGKC